MKFKKNHHVVKISLYGTFSTLCKPMQIKYHKTPQFALAFSDFCTNNDEHQLIFRTFAPNIHSEAILFSCRQQVRSDTIILLLPMQIDSLHTLVLNVGNAVHDSDWNWQNVCSPFARLYYICSGSASILIGTTQHQLKSHHLYLIPPFTKHSTHCEGRFVHYYVHIYEDGKIEEDGVFDEYDFPMEVEAFDGDEQLFARLATINPTMLLSDPNPDSYDDNQTLLRSIMHNKARTMSQKLETRGIVYQILSRFMSGATPRSESHDKRIVQATRYIRANISQRFSIDLLAEQSCLSTDHFIRLFKQNMHCTPLQYANTKRIEKAQLILLSESITVKELAFRLGYEDVSYFVRAFKRITGITPNDYRASLT